MEEEIDWGKLLDDVHVPDITFDVGEIERLLMNDDYNNNNNKNNNEIIEFDKDFFDFDFDFDFLENSPVCSSNSDSVNANEDKSSPNSDSNGEIEKLDDSKENDTDDRDDDDDKDDDPVSKKRKRQLRNRDAAMRSRERKKMYVKDLEMKSRYLEAECRRLGRLLQCCYSENQMLRFSLQSGSAFGASMSKPESAVLLPESLLLGSLVWFMALMCLLFPVPRLSLLSQGAVALAGRKDLQTAALTRPKGTNPAINLWLPLSFLTSKRCRASRTKMKVVLC